jgi:4-carboxymuconolactone decarboxylase
VSDNTPPARRFGPLPLESMTPEQRTVADAIASGPRGPAPVLRGPFEALLRSPGLADPAQKLGAFVRFGTSLPKALNEMAIIMVARRWTAQFEWYAHRQMALDAGLDPAIPDAIAKGERPHLDGDGTAVYEFVTELLERGDVSDAAFAAVESRWDKRGAADLIGAVGYYTLVSFLLNVDRYPLPEGEVPLRPLERTVRSSDSA